MKHFRKSDEPEALSNLREHEPDCTWDELRSNHSVCYEAIVERLTMDQKAICAYCERSLAPLDRQVAHFHPKSDSSEGNNWALNWNNLWLACKGGTYRFSGEPTACMDPIKDNRSCDEATEDRIVDDEVYSPSQVPVRPRIVGFQQKTDAMLIEPDDDNISEAGLCHDRVQVSLDTFNLNCRRLNEARIAVHRTIEAAVKKVVQHPHENRRIELFRSLAETHLKPIDGSHPEFFTMIRWRFGRVAEDYLEAIDYNG